MKIIVIYKSLRPEKHWCPDIIKEVGQHIPAYKRNVSGDLCWNVKGITDAVNG